MALPYLPGNLFNNNLGKTKHHKPHHFDICNDVAMMVGETKPGIGGEPRLGQKAKPANSRIPKGEGPNLPAWVAFDRQVLSFDAYYQEGVVEKREEQYRVRKCKIFFYPEDDSIQVVEPRNGNTGIPQGTIIRRHRIPKPPPNEDQFYTVEDFNVGLELNLYSKVFKITDCDEFTVNFLRKLGVRVGRPENQPDDPYMKHRKAFEGTMQPLRPYEKFDTLKQFLDHDGHVLRFYCYWDDTTNLFGDVRQLVLHYFLADDTIEIKEVIPANSGRDAVPMFLRRGPVPKNFEGLKLPGVVTDRTILNVFGPTGHGGRYILDSLKTGAINPEFYRDSDLTLGSVLNIWGRKIVLCDCDEFTKEYYQKKYGITEYNSLKFKDDLTAPVPKPVPPYNGFGSEEDSLCSCKGLLPKPPMRDFIKFMEKDRCGLESNVLRFLARLDTQKPIDKDRRFIISFFLSDDTIVVFEPPVRNSGFIGGKFMERGRVKKPNQPRFLVEMSEYYKANDLYVGACVDFNKFKFILLDTDEYALRYMEERPDEFPMSNVQLILAKVRAELREKKDDMLAIFRKYDSTGQGVISYAQLHGLLEQRGMLVKCTQCKETETKKSTEKIQPTLTEQEVITLARIFADRSEQPMLNAPRVIALVQEQLRKHNYENFNNLMDNLMYQDKNKTGFISPETVRTVFMSSHVPLPDDLLRTVLEVAPSNEKGEIAYAEFLKIINWRDCPVPPMQQPVQSDDEGQGIKAKSAVSAISYSALVDAIFGTFHK